MRKHKRPVGLTPKQIEVLKAIGDGFNTKEIASKMNTSTKNVEYHRANLCNIFKVAGSVRLARIAIGFCLSSLCLVCMAAAAQPLLVVSNPPPVVQLAWSPPASGTVSFYNVYYGVGSGQYTNRLNVGSGTNATVTLPARGVAFFFAVTDVSSVGLESPFSNEVTYTAPSPLAPPTQKPLTVLTVLKSVSPAGAFVDSGMSWSDVPDQAQTYYKLKIDKGVMLSVSQPPLPK